jgi:hypothetical protein
MTCGAQDFAYGDLGEVIVYGTCDLEPGHQGRWHRELRDGKLWAMWSGPADARAPFDWKTRAYELACDLLEIAEIAMPDSYFESDSRCQLARDTIQEATNAKN